MATYLRDQMISSIQVDEALIIHLNQILHSRSNQLKVIIGTDKVTDTNPVIIYTLRFDNKGIRFFNIDNLLAHFRSAKEIERIAMTIETSLSLNSNRQFGEYIELRLDKNNTGNSFIQVSGDDSDWVDSSYSSILDALSKNKTKHGYARSSISGLLIQIFGIISAFLLSLWAATSISPSFSIESSFVLVFLFALLIFSNIWTHLSQFIGKWVYSIFPNIYFVRFGKPGANWFFQTLIGGLAVALCLYGLNYLFGVIGDFLKNLTHTV